MSGAPRFPVQEATRLLEPVVHEAIAIVASLNGAQPVEREDFVNRLLDKLAFAYLVEYRDEDVERVTKKGRGQDRRAIGAAFADVAAAAASLGAAFSSLEISAAHLREVLEVVDLAELDRLARGRRSLPPSRFKNESGFKRTSVFREMPAHLKLLERLSKRLSGHYAPRASRGPKQQYHIDDALYYLAELFVEYGGAEEMADIPYGQHSPFIRFATLILKPLAPAGPASVTALGQRWQRFKNWQSPEDAEDISTDEDEVVEKT